MKTASAPLRALIESGVYHKADLYTLTLIDGTVTYSTSADINLIWGGHTFLSDSPRLLRDKITQSLGLEVDTLSLSAYPTTLDLISGLAFGQAVRGGLLDGARLLLEVAYLSDWALPVVGVLHGFEGRVSDIDGGKLGYGIDVKSEIEALQGDMPKNIFQSTCNHTVYDPGCTLSRSTFTVSGSVTGSASLLGFNSNRTEANGYFELGVLAFTSGPNNGTRRTIKTFLNSGGAFTFALPLPFVPVVGNTFTAYPGCSRTKEVCLNKFANQAHFKGYPFIPTPETVY